MRVKTGIVRRKDIKEYWNQLKDLEVHSDAFKQANKLLWEEWLFQLEIEKLNKRKWDNFDN